VVVVGAAGAALPNAALPNAARATAPPSLAVGAADLTVAPPVDLGTLGGATSVALGINAAGHVAGISGTEGGADRAFVWTADGGMRDLGTLGGANSRAFSINAAGQVVGGAQTEAAEFHPFLWTPAGGMRDLGTLGGRFTLAHNVNASGEVVGGGNTEDGAFHAFLWTPAAGIQDLGTLGGPFSRARDINTAGQVVGSSLSAAGPERAFRWTAEGGMEDLGTLGGAFSAAEGINDAGDAVGGSSAADGAFHAVLWSAARGMEDLTPDSPFSLATDINNAGQVVGWSRAARGAPPRAVVWARGAGLVPLPPLPGDDASEALALNDRGQVVGRSARVVPGNAAGLARAVLWAVDAATAPGAPVVSRLQAAPLPPGVYPDYAPDGGVWLRVRLTDADTPAPGPWAWRIDWGDGVVHTPTVALKGEFAFVRATPYAAPGPHTITVSATDPGGLASAEVSTPPALPECTGPVALTVSAGTTPTFSWTPACRVNYLNIDTADGAQEIWSIGSDDGELASYNTIAPGVRFGVVPPRATQIDPLVPLVPGTAYKVFVAFRLADGGDEFAGEATFTP
jgi:probable HAF family extracellular repeat protein